MGNSASSSVQSAPDLPRIDLLAANTSLCLAHTSPVVVKTTSRDVVDATVLSSFEALQDRLE